MKKILVVLLAVAMTFCLVACGGGGNEGNSENSAIPADNVLSVMFGGGTPLSMDPALNSASAGSNIIKLSFAGLMGYQEGEDGNPAIAPELAESYEVSEDGLTYTFTLRAGLKWSDGSDFVASDVVKSWQRAASSTLGADYGFLYQMFEGYDPDGDGTEMSIVADDAANTVTCKLAYAAPYFLDLCAFPVFFPVKTDIADAEGIWAIDPATSIGMGAFKMVSYAVDDVIVYEKNPNYWNAENVKLDGVKAYLSEDDTAILTAYENDTVQFINSINPDEFDRLRSTYGDEFFIADQMGTWYILFNVYKDYSPAGKQLTVQEQAKARFAMGQLINREVLVNDITKGGQVAATGFYPNGLSDGKNADVRSAEGYGKWYTGTNTPSDVNEKYTVDQVEACKTLMDLGYAYEGTLEDGTLKFTDAPAVEFSFNNAGANKAIIEYVQGTWAAFGLTATINQDAWATLQDELKKGNAEASRMGWVSDYNDCTNFIEIFISASGNNYPRLGRDIGTYTKSSDVTKDAGLGAYWGANGDQTWADAFDALDTKILYATDMAERAKLCAEAENVIMATGSVAPMYFYTNPCMQKAFLHDAWVLVSGDIILTYANFAE